MASESDYKNNAGPFAGKARRGTLVFVVLLFVIGTVLSMTGKTGAVTAQVDSRLLGVAASYGETLFIELESIKQVELVEEVDFGAAVDAEESGNTMCGTYKNDAYGEYQLRVYMKKSPFLVVTYGEENAVLVFNQGSARLTEGLYEDLTEG